jgi:hypothetical protein
VELSKIWMEFVQEAGKESVHQWRWARLTLRLLVGFLRDALAFGLSDGDDERVGDDQPLLEAMTQRANADQITALLERWLEADFQIERNAGTVPVLEAMLEAFAQRLAPSEAP